MMFRLSSATVAFICLVGLPVSAFVPSVSQVQSSPQTSTTLYYRDDVPPIGSAPRWETPNDFDQFLTQCTIQSFTFLLNSLRDDYTVRWLDDFTQPVFEKPVSKPSPTAEKKTPPPPKVSLAEAAQTALLETEKALTKGKVVLPKKLEETVGSVKKQNNVMNVATLATIEKKSNKSGSSSPQEAHLTMLDERISLKTAFASFSKAKLMATKNLAVITSTEKDEEEPRQLEEVKHSTQPETPICNTGIDQLYSSRGIPPERNNNPPIVQKPFGQDQAPPMVKKNYSPFGKKPRGVPPSPLGSVAFRPGIPYYPSKKTYAPYGNIPKAVPHNKHTGGFVPVPSTSPLYGGEKAGKVPKAQTDEGNNNDKEVEAVKEERLDRTTDNEPKSSVAAGLGSVLKYHGLGILNNTRFPTWDSYFEQLLDQPKELFLVQSYHPQMPDIELDIDPASVCRRMISVRAQIAEEFEHDLEVIANMGELTLKSYHKMLEEIREQRAEEELQQKKDDLESLMTKSMEDSISNNNGAKSTTNVDDAQQQQPVKPQMQRANLLFLDRAVGGVDKADLAPSPLRKGNFDLLCLLATQEAIHRVLNDPKRQARKSPEHGSNQFLQDFYVTRLLSHFSGDQRYRRSDDFLEELLDCPPRMITIGNTNDDKPQQQQQQQQHEDELTKDLTYLVDPVKVAETILKEREVVSLEWKQHLSDQVKADHMAIQRMVLTKIMGSTVEECQVTDSDGNDIDSESCFE